MYIYIVSYKINLRVKVCNSVRVHQIQKVHKSPSLSLPALSPDTVGSPPCRVLWQ